MKPRDVLALALRLVMRVLKVRSPSGFYLKEMKVHWPESCDCNECVVAMVMER